MNDKLREANIELGLWGRWHFDEACRLKRLSRKGPRTRETIAYHQRRTEAIGLVADKLRAALADTADAPPEVTEEMAELHEISCYDCGRPYSDGGFPDLVLPNDTWTAISPTGDEGGMLCPSCICKRLADRGFEKVPAVFRSGPCCVHSEEGS